jgi:hypothetical protein
MTFLASHNFLFSIRLSFQGYSQLNSQSTCMTRDLQVGLRMVHITLL